MSDGDPAALKPVAPGLYLVATPIGNLEDITLRALRVLRGVDRIACEDTRKSAHLLQHFGITTPTVSYHMHNETGRGEELLRALEAGGRIAVISDAGTPGIADPGTEIVAAAAAAGIPVYPIPGANAALAAVVGSALPTEHWTFHGFLPAKAGQRRSALEALPRDGSTEVFYEAPTRILAALADVAHVFGPGQPVVVARELTKIYEEFLRGPVEQVREQLAGREAVRGEIVLLLAPSPAALADDAAGGESLRGAIERVMAGGVTEKDALKQVARERGLGKSKVYREWQRERRR